MSTVNKVIITTIIVVVVILGGWWLIASMSEDNSNESSNQNGQGESSEPSEDQEAAATITYNGNEFSPATITVKAGDIIKVVNDSDGVLFFASDEHPTHLDNSELNAGDIEPGASATFSITSSGTWGYHDHYNAGASGEIIVE
jgi:plastocyanin